MCPQCNGTPYIGGITMQAATAATIEYTDYPECERRIYPTENDIAFYKTYEFCEAEGALQVYSKPEGVGHKLSAIRQMLAQNNLALSVLRAGTSQKAPKSSLFLPKQKTPLQKC